MVQKHGVNGFAHGVVAAKTKRHIGHTARHFGAGQVLFDPTRGFNEIDGVVVVFFNARGNGKNVGVKNDVFGWEVHLIDQYAVCAFANFNFALVGIGLAFFIKSHDHRSRTISLDELRLLLKAFHALFHADGIDNALALNATQTRFNDTPFGRVDHDGHAGNVGLRRNQVQEPNHGRLAVQHGFVHVDVNNLRTVFNLLTGHCQSLLVLAIQNHAGKCFRACDVGALTNVHKQRVGTNRDRL